MLVRKCADGIEVSICYDIIVVLIFPRFCKSAFTDSEYKASPLPLKVTKTLDTRLE